MAESWAMRDTRTHKYSPKKCIECGTEFLPSSGNQKFCYEHWKLLNETDVSELANRINLKEEVREDLFSHGGDIGQQDSSNKTWYVRAHPHAFDSLVKKPEIKPKPVSFSPPARAKVSDPTLLTVKELATFLRVDPLTLKRWEKKGQIKSIRINSRGDRRYLRTEINRILEVK